MEKSIKSPENNSFPVHLVYNDGRYDGLITPVPQPYGAATEFRLVFNGTYAGRVKFLHNKWRSDDISEEGLIAVIGRYIEEHHRL